MNRANIGKINNSNPQELHRDEWLALLLDFSENLLTESERQRVEQHLKECPACNADLEGLQSTAGLLRRLPEVAPPRSFAIGETQARKARKDNSFYLAARTVAAVAAVFLLFFAGLDIAGIFTPPAPVASVAVATSPNPTLPSVGTVQPGTGTGALSGLGGVTVAPSATPTAGQPVVTPVPSSAPKASLDTPVLIRVLEVALLVSVILFTVFAFALRPRAPGQKKAL